MKTLKLSAATRTLAEYAAEFSDDIVVLTEGNRAVAAIVPLKGVDRASIALSAHPGFLRIIARGRGEIRRGRTISLARMKALLGIDGPPNQRLQPTKARRPLGKKPAKPVRLRG